MAYKEKKEPIRVLQYIGSLNLGGSQAMIMNIYRNMNREDIQFDFVVDRKTELLYKDEIEGMGGKVFIFDQYMKGYNLLSYNRQWKRFFNQHPEYRILHCHVRSVASIVLRIAKKYGLKTICHSHSISNGRGAKALAKKVLQKGIVKHSDYLLACSRKAAEWLYGSSAANSEKCIIIHNAIDSKKYCFDKSARKKIRNELGIHDDTVLVGHIGRFVEVKNHRFMLDLAKQLEKDSIAFVFCGEGDMKEEIIRNKTNNVLVYDKIQNANELYSAMDVFILPSKYEGLGMVLIEAQFNGLFCIASNAVPKEVAISKEIVFLPLDLKLWSRELSGLLPRQNVTNSLLDTSKKYSIAKEVIKTEKLYKELSGAYRDNE